MSEIISKPNTIYTAMAAIIKEVKAVGKSKTADMGNAGKYQFRGIDDMYNELHTAFANNEVFIIPKVLSSNLEVQEKIKTWNGSETKSIQFSWTVTVEYSFMHSSGTSISAIGVGHALDTSDKGTNKAQSSALKYCLMQTLLIPTIDDKDVENQNNTVAEPVIANERQLAQLDRLIDELSALAKTDRDTIVKWIKDNYSIKTAKNINVPAYNKIIKKLQAKILEKKSNESI